MDSHPKNYDPVKIYPTPEQIPQPGNRNFLEKLFPKVKPEIRSLILPVILLVVISFLVIGLILIANKPKGSNLPPTQIPISTVEPTPVPNPTENWKTYMNDKYGFEFEYPDDLNNKCCEEYSDSLYGMAKVITLAQKLDTDFEGGAEIYNGLTISLALNKTNTPLDTFVEDQKIKNLQRFYGEDQLKTALSKIKTTRVGIAGQEGLLITNQPVLNIDIIYLPIQNNKYFISIYKSEEHDKEFDKTFDQILSTFKFLDSEENAEGKFCGGIAANLPENQCPEGYKCKLDGNYPDAGGKSVKN